jgi:hypothetical protein
MKLGAFSISLTVKDIHVSKAFYENSTGPAHFMIEDPDGNPILVDQHRQ